MSGKTLLLEEIVYILIAFFITVNIAANQSETKQGVAMQEFSSQASCMEALRVIKSHTNQDAVCVRK